VSARVALSTQPLRVAIVGGGIGGLAAATALLQRGIDVQLYEQAPALAEIGAGVAIQPNGIRMLRRLSLGDGVTRYGARWTDAQFRRQDGTFAASMWPADLAGDIEIYGFHRADLLSLLVDRLPPGVAHTGHRCVGFEQNESGATVTFANGVRATADIVVGADGIHSNLQQFVVAPSPAIFSGSVASRGIIPSASVTWPAGAMRNWMGAGKHFIVFPVRRGELLNYVGFVATEERTEESWSALGERALLARDFAGWDPMVGAIITQIKATFRWGVYHREPLSRWTEGRLTLLGDAAHPMLPHAGQGANQAIEDGVALAAVLARANRTSAPRALLIYEKLRREHTAGVQSKSRSNSAKYEAASGDLARRDQSLATQYQERARIWNYDAEAEATAAAAAL
jgi:salicylate hydroxylase